MKIRLEKLTVKISKLTGGKMKNLNGGPYMKNFGQEV